MVEVMKIMSPPSKGPSMHCCTQWPQPCSRPPPTHASARDSWTLTGLSGSLLLSPGSWCTRLCLCLQGSVSPGLCRVWRLCGALMATSSKSAYAIPRSTTRRASALQQATADPGPTGDAQTQFCLSLCGVSGSWWAQGLFEPSERLCWAWGLILNMILPLLPPFWGFSFALGHGVSLQSHSAPHGHCSNANILLGLLYPWTWGIPSKSEQDPVSPSVSLSYQEASISLLSFSIRGQAEWKPQSQKTNQSDCMDHSLV